jgi:hypothetical protein
MSYIKYFMLALILLATMEVLTCGQAPVKLNGSEGQALLKQSDQGLSESDE